MYALYKQVTFVLFKHPSNLSLKLSGILNIIQLSNLIKQIAKFLVNVLSIYYLINNLEK